MIFGKGRKFSYIKRHFFYLFFMMVILVSAMGAAMIHFSKNIVGNEIVKLHQALLKQSANVTADAVGSLKESLENIAQNARVIDWLGENDAEEAEDTTIHYIDSLIQDELYKNLKRGSICRVYLYDHHSLRYGSDRPYISWDEVRGAADLQDAPDVQKQAGVVLAGPVKSDEAGLYRHSFYLIQPVKDLLDYQVKGYVLIQFSEKILYDTYSDLRGSDRKYGIVNQDGILVSGENKSEIGGSQMLGKDLQPDGAFVRERGYHTLTGKEQEYMYFYEEILGTDWYLLERINVHDIWSALDRSGYFSLCLMGLFILCLFPLTVVSGRNILKPVDKIKDKMGQVAEGNLSVRIQKEERGKGEFAEIADSFNFMVEQLETQVEEIRGMERKKHLLELDFLRAQINPHFIYNTLSSIRFYVEMGKNEEAEDMLIDFSKVLRKTLSRTETLSSLKDEIETLKHYINLQNARYRNRFEVSFDIEESTLPSLIPDFILQPIVENAIFYSLREDVICHICISSHLEGTDLYVSVKDDGIGMAKEKIDTVLNKELNINKVGIKNVNERLKLNFGAEYGIKIISEEGCGTEVILIMPCTAERKRLK